MICKECNKEFDETCYVGDSVCGDCLDEYMINEPGDKCERCNKVTPFLVETEIENVCAECSEDMAVYEELTKDQKHINPKLIRRDHIPDDMVKIMYEAEYRVITIIPYTEEPVQHIYRMDQVELDRFIEHYNECAEFIIEIVACDFTKEERDDASIS